MALSPPVTGSVIKEKREPLLYVYEYEKGHLNLASIHSFSTLPMSVIRLSKTANELNKNAIALLQNYANSVLIRQISKY